MREKIVEKNDHEINAIFGKSILLLQCISETKVVNKKDSDVFFSSCPLLPTLKFSIVPMVTVGIIDKIKAFKKEKFSIFGISQRISFHTCN